MGKSRKKKKKMTRTRKPDVSETDVSSKKMKIQKKKTGSPEVTRVAAMPSQNVSPFQKRWGRYRPLSRNRHCNPERVWRL